MILIADHICGDGVCPHNRVGHSPRKNNLILKKVNPKDTGYYECIARLPDGRESEKTTVYLDVLSMLVHDTMLL